MKVFRNDEDPFQKGIEPLEEPSTRIVNTNDTLFLNELETGDDPLNAERQIVLLIQNTPVRLLLTHNLSITIGRADKKINYFPELDVASFGGVEKGVSRAHARLTYRNRQLYITDLNSANGTFVGGERLRSNEPKLLKLGDAIMLGKLLITLQLPR
jgi:pSer/pThr/pTyr-binding forkhead associated (FHA) protein